MEKKIKTIATTAISKFLWPLVICNPLLYYELPANGILVDLKSVQTDKKRIPATLNLVPA
jgi:capsule polysaccharide export protein KpsE/RkpR